MARKPGNDAPPAFIHHPKTADAKLTEFRRVIGSIALTGPIPSKYFLDHDPEPADDRASD